MSFHINIYIFAERKVTSFPSNAIPHCYLKLAYAKLISGVLLIAEINSFLEGNSF